jgi:hypothetical protein
MNEAGDVLTGALAAHSPMSRASRARSVRSDVDTCQPTTKRENTSRMNAA